MAIRRLDHVNFITHDMPATIDFYCNLIGLVCRQYPTVDSLKTVYLYLPDEKTEVLHIGYAKRARVRPDFTAMASLTQENNGEFSTGSFDHFCLALDESDYELYLNKIKAYGRSYQTYSDDNVSLKQIWLLDPNGVRVELNFS